MTRASLCLIDGATTSASVPEGGRLVLYQDGTVNVFDGVGICVSVWEQVREVALDATPGQPRRSERSALAP
jgi:hypothetical protein